VRPEVIEAAHPALHDVLVPAARRERGLAGHDEAIEPGEPRSAAGVETHRAMVTARPKRRKS
jgi:hypothetical protein